jgi:Flp pilus assembly secretin CpaC
MSRTTHRSVCSLLVAACATTCSVWAVPGFAGPAPLTEQSISPDRVLDHAANLVAEGKLIRAKAMLDALQNSPAAATLGDEAGKRLWNLRSGVERQIRSADRAEMSLQQAELALAEDNLVTAERQASAVVRSGQADAVQTETAKTLLGMVDTRRAEIAPQVPEALRLSEEAFKAGDYAKAKDLIERVNRSGVALTNDQQKTLDASRSRIVELELARGTAFQTASMGMLAPESGMSSAWLTGNTQDGARSSGSYVAQPEQPASQPIEVQVIDPATASGDTQPAQVDLIEAARRFEAQTLLGEADRAYGERQLGTATDKYQRLVSEFSAYLTPEQSKLAQDRLNELRAGINAQGGPGDALEQTIGDRSLARDRAVATYNNQMAQARDALAQGNPTGARNLAAQAKLTVQQARDVMAESDFDGRIAEVDSLLIEIAGAEERIRITQQQETDARIAAETDRLNNERQAERDQRIISAIERVRALQQELKYEEALEVVESILFLDPTNPSGLLLRDIIEDTIIYRKFLGYERDKAQSYVRERVDNAGAMVIPSDLMAYPSDWPAISFRRGEPLEFAESEADRSVLATLRETRLPVDFTENAFEDVVAFIGNTARVDIDVDWESLADIGVDPDTPVTMRLREVPVETILDRVVAKVSDPDLPAGWAIQDGIITIASDEILRRNTVLEIYDIRDLLFVIPNFDNAPEFDLSAALQAGASGGGGGSSPFQGGNDDNDDLDPEERIQQIVDLIQANIDPDGWVDLGGSTSSITELNGNFVITTTARNHRAIIGLLGKLRAVRSLQINVEARFLAVSQDFFEQIGFDLDVYFNANNNEFTTASQIDPSLLPSNYFDPSTGQLLPNVTGGGFFVDSDGDGVVDTPITQPVLTPQAAGDQWSVISAAQNSFGLTEQLAGASSFATDILGATPALGITGRFLDDVQVDFLVQATQADQRSVSLTAPRLTFTNGQQAYIAVATSTTFVSDLEPVTGDSAAAFDPVITPLPTGVLLDVTGVVSSDRRYVTLTVDTRISEATFGTDLEVEGAVGGTGGSSGGGTFTGTIQVPIVTTTQIETTVTVPDQGTVLLGGQRLVEELEVETGVPVLSKIPILSRFFSNRIDVKEEQTLIVLIKPTILIQNEEEEKNFPGLLDQLGG